MIYQHPLGYLIAMEGAALLRAWHGDFDEAFVQARLDEVRGLVTDPALTGHPGVHVEPGATGAAYRQWSTTYDDPGNELLELDLPFVDAILDSLPTGTAVDTACGTGRLVRRLAGRGHRALGIDRSDDMVRQARRTCRDLPFVVGDLHDLPLPDSSVDLVTNALALTHVNDLDRVMSELARVLRPGGVAVISDVHPDLVLLGSAVKAEDPAGRPQLATCHRRSVADYLRAALSAGFLVRGFDERPRRGEVAAPPADAPQPEPAREVGAWRDWPWTLLDWTPDASKAAWDIPAVVLWHLERE